MRIRERMTFTRNGRFFEVFADASEQEGLEQWTSANLGQHQWIKSEPRGRLIRSRLVIQEQEDYNRFRDMFLKMR